MNVDDLNCVGQWLEMHDGLKWIGTKKQSLAEQNSPGQLDIFDSIRRRDRVSLRFWRVVSLFGPQHSPYQKEK